MITNDKLLHRIHFVYREAFVEMAEAIGSPTVYDALTTLLDAKFSAMVIGEKFDIPYETVRRVVMRIRPDILDSRGRSISATRSERHGLRLLDGTTLREHCRQLGLGSPQSAAYARERRRLVLANNLFTAEEYRRNLNHKPRC